MGLRLTCEKFVGLYALYMAWMLASRAVPTLSGKVNPAMAQGVIAAFLHRVARAESIAMFGDGSVIRDFIHVSDLARALLDLQRGVRTACR